MIRILRYRNGLRFYVPALAVLLLALAGCKEQTDLIAASYQVADALMAKMDPPGAREEFPVMVASFVNIDNLERSSTFGRAAAEYIGSKFSQSGYKVIELKLRDTVYIKENGGEFLLSREVKNLSKEHEVKALVVGTYSVAADILYIAARVVDPSSAAIVATYDCSFPLGGNLSHLLGSR